MKEKRSTIRITQKYVITTDSMNYTLQQAYINKKGKERLCIIGHYPSIEKAFASCRDEMFKDELFKKDEWSLDDAITLFARVTNHLEAIVKHNFEGVTI